MVYATGSPQLKYSFQESQRGASYLSIVATVRNYSSSRGYGLYLDDHAAAEGIKVQFFDGEPEGGRQIGSDLRIERLIPLQYENVSVDWNITKLRGNHTINVLVFPGENIVRALNRRSPRKASISIDLDLFHSCTRSLKAETSD